MASARFGLLSLGAAVALGLAACAEDRPAQIDDRAAAQLAPAQLKASFASGAGIDPALYAGQVQMRVDAPIPAGGRDLPATALIGFAAESETRLRLRALVDLRALQADLPQLVPDVLEESCSRVIRFELEQSEAVEQHVVVRGKVHADLFSCADGVSRGRRWISQSVDVVATVSASLDDLCVGFRVVDLELYPSGLVGTLSDLVGVTGRIRRLVLSEATKFFEETPLCPELPAELAALEPDATAGGPQEIGTGGLGARVTGTVDTSASTLIALLSILNERRLFEGQK